MKKILLIILFCLPLLLGQAVHYANQITVAWNPVSDSGVISYEVFTSAYPVSDPQNPDAHSLVAETSESQAVVTFQSEGKFSVGVRTKKVIDGETLYSVINWSHENGADTPDPFVVGYYVPPAVPQNMRLE